MIRTILQSVLLAVAEMFEGPLRAAVSTLASLVGQLDLPDGDPKWESVGVLVEQTVRDIRDASERDDDPQGVRDAAEHRMHLELRRLGLLERG